MMGEAGKKQDFCPIAPRFKRFFAELVFSAHTGANDVPRGVAVIRHCVHQQERERCEQFHQRRVLDVHGTSNFCQ